MTTCAQRSGSQTRWRSAQQRIHLGGKTWRHGDVPVNGGANGAFSDAERWENDTWYHILIKMVMVIQLVMVMHHYHIHVIQLVMDIIPWYHVYIWDLDIHMLFPMYTTGNGYTS